MSQTQVMKPGSRFGIARVIIVVAICAVALACAFPGTHIPGRPKPGANFWNIVFGLSNLTVGLFSLLGGALVASNWIRDRRAPEDPGCLLFLFCAFAFFLSNAGEGLYASFLDELQPGDPSQGVAYVAGVLYVRCLTQIFLAFVCVFGFPRNQWWWQIGFLCLMFSMFAKLGMTVISFNVLSSAAPNRAVALGAFASGVVAAVTLIWLLVCGVIDYARKVKRSRLHWFGILCFLVFSTLPTITIVIASRYLSLQEIFGVG